MKKIFLLLLFLVSLLQTVSAQTPIYGVKNNILTLSAPGGTNVGAESGTKIFVMAAGQSNCLGLAPDANLQSDLITPITNDYIFNLTNYHWETLTTSNNPGGGTFGIEFRLMKLLHDANPAVDQFLYKYAVTGTQLYNSGSGATQDWNPGSSNELYANLLTQYNASIANHLIDNLYPTWFVWIQGEQDGSTDVTAAAYETNLTLLINSIRTDFSLPNLKFVIVSLSSNQSNGSLTTTRRNTIITAQTNVANAMTGVYLYTQNNTTTDGIHYDATGYDNIANGVYNIIASH